MNLHDLNHDSSFKCKVSSVLNKDRQNYGGHLMFDKKEDTCWNSSSGHQQSIQCEYENFITFNQVHIQYQGGFSAAEFSLEVVDKNSEEKSEVVYTEDNNSYQKLLLGYTYVTKSIKIVFTNMLDPFGRIIIYKLGFTFCKTNAEQQ